MAQLRLLPALAWLALLVPAIASAQPCPWTVNPTASQAVFDRLKALPQTTEGCALSGQNAESSRIIQRWRHAGETFQVPWAPRACTQGDDPRIVPLDLRPLQTACPQLAQAVQQAADAHDWPRADKPVPLENPRQFGREYQIVMATAALEVLLALGLLVWLALAARQVAKLPEPLRKEQLLWWRAGAVLTLLALLMRFLVPPSLSNWYTPTLALREIPRAEFYGGGHLALQWLLREMLPWTDRTLFAANQLLGAAIVPLWLCVLRQRGVLFRTAVLAAGLLAVVPLHVRLSNSASEHVLVALAWMAALAAWQASVRAPRWLPRLGLGLLAAGLGLLAALTRIEATVLVGLLALWVLPVDRVEPAPPLARRLLAATLWLLLCVGLLAVLQPMLDTMVLDRGRQLPTWPDRRQALHDVPDGLWRLFFGMPGWLGPLVGTLTLAGLLLGLRRYPWLLLLCVLSFLAVPLGIGRSPFDFIMMRYYLAVLPVLTLPAAVAVEPWTHRRWLTPALLLVAVLFGWPAWHARYAFQDEYTWLRSRLGEERRACTVAQIPVSNRHQRNSDVDCCLDLARCPLVAALPEMTFVAVETPEQLLALPGDCLYYYEGAVCGMQATDDVKQRRPAEYRAYMEQCQAMRQTPGLVLGGETEVTPRGHFDAFGAGPVRVRLWRVEREPGHTP